MASLAEWRAWATALPHDLDRREQYTATLLTTLASIIETAPFEWGLTGGTALQSFLAKEDRRYSTDLEIITPATRDDVRDWMQDQGYTPEEMGSKALLTSLTPDGTLFVIHDYPPDDLEAADIVHEPFDHYPLQETPPPDHIDVPRLGLPYLLATKLYAIQEERRGGERKKDAYDLALALPLARTDDVLEKLEIYAAHQGRPGDHYEIARAAGAWLDHFASDGFSSLSRWMPNYVPQADPTEVRDGLEAAVAFLADALGQSIEPTERERVRFLLQELSPAELAPLAEALGFDGNPLRESEKLRDFIVATVVERAAGPLPSDTNELRELLEEISD